jgi:hypothetical protein
LSYKQIVPAISFKGVFFNGRLMHDSYQAAKKEWVGDSLEFLVFPQLVATVGDVSVRIRMKGKKSIDIFVRGTWESSFQISCVSPSLPAGVHKLVITGEVLVVFNTFSFFVFKHFPFYEVPCGILENGEVVRLCRPGSF